MNVIPTEIENILLTHNCVENAAVIGINDEERGEVPMAFITVVEDSDVNIKEIIDYVNSRVDDKSKQIRGGIRVLDTLPMTPLMKINKMKLKKMVED